MKKHYIENVITLFEDEDYIYSLYFCKNIYLVKDTTESETLEDIKEYNDNNLKQQRIFEMGNKLYVRYAQENGCWYPMEGTIKQIKSITK